MTNMYDLIAALCNARGVNMTQMCKGAGIPRGNMTELKKGRTQHLSTKTLAKLSAYFDIPIDVFISPPEDVEALQEVLFGVEVSRGKTIKKEPTADDSELAKNKLALIEFAMTIPEEKAAMILQVMRTIVEGDQ